MKKIYYVIVILLLLVTGFEANAQRIRKNYREMTTAEKQAYCNALDVLRANGTIATLGTLHSSNFTPIHNRPMFLPWHRYFSFDVESMLRATGVAGAQNISMPYWDWTSQFYPSPAFVPDNSKSAPLWTDPNFIGKYNALWSLGRSTTGSNLTFGTTISTVLAKVPFGDYSSISTNFAPSLEYNLHNSPHGWVGGIMGGGSSPVDPVFFLHHNMVDKIWQNWHNLGGGRVSSGFNASSMPTYPNIHPDSIVDSRKLKVWYAENNQVLLDKYSASGTEKYRYTGTIKASTFTANSGTNVEMISAKEIVYTEGFVGKYGTNLIARIDANSFQVNRMSDELAEDSEPALETSEYMSFDESKISVSPNPSSGIFTVSLITNSELTYSYQVLDQIGKVVASGNPSIEKQFDINLVNLPKGMYILQVNANAEVYYKKLILVY